MGLRLFDLARGQFEHGVVRTRVDVEERVARFDVLALLEMDLLEVPRDAGLDVDGVHRLDAAGEDGGIGNLAGDEGRDLDLRLRLFAGRLGVGLTTEHGNGCRPEADGRDPPGEPRPIPRLSRRFPGSLIHYHSFPTSGPVFPERTDQSVPLS